MRSDEEILAGELVLRFDGEEKVVRELRIKELRAWKLQLTGAIGGIGNIDFSNPKEVPQIAGLIGDRMLDLVVAYDTAGSLGGKPWLEEHATEAEIYRAFRSVLEAAFPFVGDLRGLAGQLQTLVQSAPPNSMNGPLPAGGSRPKVLKQGSRQAS